MVSVTADQIRKRLGLTVADISDTDVLAFRDEVTAFLSEEIGKTLNADDCAESEAMLSAIWEQSTVIARSLAALQLV